MAEETEKENPNEKLKKRALDAYKHYRTDMDKLAAERIKANKYYYGEPRGDEVEGRSKLISRDVYEIIEAQMPSLMRIFYGGQRVVEVTPVGEDDVLKAPLMEEKINFDFQKSNKGFKILYQFFKDALLHRLGVVAYCWDKTPKWKFHEYDSVSHTYYMDLKNGLYGEHIIDKAEEIREGIKGIDETWIVEPLYNISCRERIKQSRPLFTNVPLEDISFDIDMKDAEDPEVVIIHRIRIHKRKLKEYGFNEDDINDTISKYDASAELQSRFEDLGGLSFITDDKDTDFVFLYLSYLYDFDDDGNPIPKIVPIVGEKCGTVQVNKYGRPPFCFITPIIIAHRLIGLSTESGARDIQDASTAFLRNIADNAYYQNNGEVIWNPFRATPPGERIPGQKTMMTEDGDPRMVAYALPTTPLAPQTVNIYSQILPKIKSRRFGINDFNQGLDPKALATRTSGGISQLMTSSMQPQELLARCFAETGVRDMFVADMQMNIDFLDIEVNLKINKEWRKITRDSINGLFDISIDVGIGTGSKDMIFNQLINMLNTYGGIANVAGPYVTQIFTPQNIKELLIAAWELLGFKNAKGRFVANDTTGAETITNPAGAEGAAIPGTQESSGIPGTPSGLRQVYNGQVAA